GQSGRRSGEVADLAGVDDRHGQARRSQTCRHHGLEAAGRLEHDESWCYCIQPFGQFLNGLAIAPDGEALTAGANMNIQAILGDIDTDEHGFWLPSLRMRARGSALATVRDDKIDGGGTLLRDGLACPRSVRALRRHRTDDFTPVRPFLDTRSGRRPRLEGSATDVVLVPILRDATLRVAPQDEASRLRRFQLHRKDTTPP